MKCVIVNIYAVHDSLIQNERNEVLAKSCTYGNLVAKLRQLHAPLYNVGSLIPRHSPNQKL